jgi:uncharacterized OsmC-like protein
MAFPHFYSVRAEAGSDPDVIVRSGGVPPLTTAPTPEFGGPGNRWSPETLTVGAVGDCLILTFKEIARKRDFAYRHVTCDVQGKLDRRDHATAFTDFYVKVRVQLPPGGSFEQARRLIDLAKQHCLITNSLKGTVHFEVAVDAE